MAEKRIKSQAPTEPETTPEGESPEAPALTPIQEDQAMGGFKTDTTVADKVDEEAKKEAVAEADTKSTSEADMANDSMKDFAQIIAEAIRGNGVPYVQADVTGVGETTPGGRYILNNRVVDAEGRTLEPNEEEKKTLEVLKKAQATALRGAGMAPEAEKDVAGGEL